MSGPAGPVRPPTNHPKVNVLMIYGLLATSATFSTVLLADGGWKWCGLLPGAVAVILLTAAVRAGVEAEREDSEAG